MTFTATPHPETSPPSVVLDYTLDEPGSIVSYEVTRNGEELRFSTVPSGNQIILTDFEAPYVAPLTYIITGQFLPDVVADWTETWASLAAWTGDTADYSTSGGKARSLVYEADIVRPASGTIQRITVLDPDFVRVELLTAGDAVVASIEITDNVTLTGTSATSTSGGGSFSAVLDNNSIVATADDSSWALERPYSGTPTKVRIVALPRLFGAYLSKFGSFGSGNGQLDQPQGIAIDSADNIFVVDQDNNRVMKFNSAGVYQSQFGSFGGTDGRFNRPQGIAIDSADNIFVVDQNNQRVQKFNPAGVYQSKFGTGGSGNGQFNSPEGIAIDSADNIFVADWGNNRVQKFNSAGVYQSQFGSFGSGNGQFDGPEDIAIDSANSMFVTDGLNHRVQKFNSAGVYQFQFGSFGSGNGQFDQPHGIAVDSTDNILVVDRGNDRVQKFNPAGVYQSQFGSSGLGNGQFNGPEGIAMDSVDNIFVTDSQNHRVQKFVGDPLEASIDDVAVYLETPPEFFSDTATTQLDSEDAWMIHPFNTGLSLNIGRDTGCASVNIEVSPDTKRTAVSQTRSVLLNPVGRRRWLAITQQDRMVAAWDLVLVTESLADRDSIIAFLEADIPFLLRSPASFDWDLPDDWYSVGDVPDERETFWLSPTPAECGHHYNRLVLPLYPVDAPAEPVPPAWTYGQDFLAYPTYADSFAAQPTYLDRLVGPSV